MEISLNLFDNREKAIILWIVVVIVVVLFKKQLREALFNVVKALLKIKILVPIFLMAAYITLIIFVANKIRLWDISMLDGTIIWFFGVGFVMFFNYGKAAKENNYFKETILGALGLTAIVAFINNVYVSPFLVEFLLVIPGLFILGALLAYSGTQKKFALVHNVLQWVVGVKLKSIC